MEDGAASELPYRPETNGNTDRKMHTFKGDGDSRSLNRARHEFTFTKEPPFQISERMMDSYRPRSPGYNDSRRDGYRRDRSPDDSSKRRRGPPDGPRNWDRDRARDRERERDRDRRGGGSWSGRGRQHDQQRKPWQPVPAHNRPILLVSREKTPEQLIGMMHTTFEDTAEHDEPEEENRSGSEGGSEDMDIDSDYEHHEKEVLEGSRVAIVEDIKEGEEVVKAEKQKMDVIDMIRKAKAKPNSGPAVVRNEVAANDDFISFGFSDDENKENPKDRDNDSDYSDYGKKKRKTDDTIRMERIEEDSPRSDRYLETKDNRRTSGTLSHKEGFHRYLEEKLPSKDIGPPGASSTLTPANLPPPPGLPSALPIYIPPATHPQVLTPIEKPTSGISFTFNKSTKGSETPLSVAAVQRSRKALSPLSDLMEATGYGGQEEQSAWSPHGKKRKYDEAHPRTGLAGQLSPDYIMDRGSSENPYPWLSSGLDHTRSLSMADWLHKEIVDFISYIKPRRYEHSVRRHIIHQIRKSITHSLTDVDVRVFGSFASHLYLPTADLDLAVISRDFATSGYQKYSAKKTLYRVSDLLKRANIPKNGDVTVISGAKVPILKFVERKTGLNVDICFENFSGLTANRTFKEWKEEHKALPPLAVILKHFLDMRKLNEVYNGGLGGFSVICMIVSMLQLHPAVCSGNMKMEENLGIALLDFLKLYGKDFNTENVGIDVVGRGYFRKPPLPYNPRQKPHEKYLLHIVDPNDASNNIAKSSYQVTAILRCFGQAYDALISRMGKLNFMTFEERQLQQRNKKGPPFGNTILGTLLGGNYRVIENQRETMRKVYQEIFQEEARDEEEEDLVDDEEVFDVPQWWVDNKGRSTEGGQSTNGAAQPNDHSTSRRNGRGTNDLDGTITDGAQPSNKDNESKKPKNPKKSRLTRSMKKQHRKESDEQRRDEALLHENSAGSGAASLTEEIEQHAIGTGAQKRPQRSERLQKIHQQKEETRKSQNNSTADRSTGCTLPDTITQAARDETLYAERTRKRERNKWVKKQKAQKEARAKRLPKVGNEDLGKGPSGPEYTPQASKRKPRKPRCGATRSNNIIPTENSGAIYIIDD